MLPCVRARRVVVVRGDRAVGSEEPRAPLGVGHPAVVEAHDSAEQAEIVRERASARLGAAGLPGGGGAHEDEPEPRALGREAGDRVEDGVGVEPVP